MNDLIREFAEEARQYCALIEGGGPSNSRLFAEECLRRLLRLYERALLLPSTEHPSTQACEPVDLVDTKLALKSISSRLEQDFYWCEIETWPSEAPEHGVGSLADDLVDVWMEMKVGLWWLDIRSSEGAAMALWHWRYLFEKHWGEHAASAIGAMHALCFGLRTNPAGSTRSENRS